MDKRLPLVPDARELDLLDTFDEFPCPCPCPCPCSVSPRSLSLAKDFRTHILTRLFFFRIVDI